MELIINNENKILLRNRKRRNERKTKMNDGMKILLHKIKSEKKKKKKNFDKIKQLEILSVRIEYADKTNKLERALKELHKIQGFDKYLHGIKNEIVLDYVGEFEVNGDLKVGDQIRQTVTRFEKMDILELLLFLSIKIMIQKMLFSKDIFKN